MKKQTACVSEWGKLGGSFIIPDGWFVCGANFDLPKPEVRIIRDSHDSEEQTILIPKSLAYFLGVHFCGSHVMREALLETGRQEIIQGVRLALRL